MSEQLETVDTLWGAKDIGAAIGLTERQAKYWLKLKQLPARKIGVGRGRWCASRKALQAHVAGQGLQQTAGEDA